MLHKDWELSHAFFAIMGGFHYYNDKGPVHPLHPYNVVELVKRGHLVPPTGDEIEDKSKGDALSKGVALIQTLWFVMQCIARRVEGLPISNLEVMTLAYTVITVAMYAAWWDKPLNVACAVRVRTKEVRKGATDDYESIWERIFDYVIGQQDEKVDLRECKRVPTFWAAEASGNVGIADVIALLVATVFGAVHCIAWHFALIFQSHLEQQLWRYSAIAIIATPAALGVATTVAYLRDVSNAVIIGIPYFLIAIIYIVARFILVVLSFTTLKHLPLDTYKTIVWTTFIPHI